MSSAHETFQWPDIAADFTDALILGNGASIAIDSRFNYRSLREKAESLDLLSPDLLIVFARLPTDDFEFVLRVLWHAQLVNHALKIDDPRTEGAYSDVKHALIAVVKAVHPPFAEVAGHLARAAEFMRRFDTVVSMSYDLLVYWAMQLANESAPNRFKDCWLEQRFQNDWEWLRQPFSSNDKATLVFFPHGNVVLGSDLLGSEVKVATDPSSNLLDTIAARWEEGVVTPLFVSEGTSSRKLSSILASPYLSSVLREVLPTIGQTVVVHGSSFSDEDEHLLDAVCSGRRKPRRFAVSSNPDSPLDAAYRGRVEAKLGMRLGKDGFRLFFYDWRSPGCWVTS